MSPQPNTSSGLEPFDVLRNRWYNSLSKNLHLDRSLFQIRYPTNPIIHTSEDLWDLLDVVPPLSLTFHSLTHSAPRFSAEYISIITQFQYPEKSLSEIIGADNYKKWLLYLGNIHPTPVEAQLPALFRQWSILTAPSVTSAGVAWLSQTLVLHRTLHNLETYRGPQAKKIDFSPELVQANDIVKHSTGFDFAFEGEDGSDDVTDTWTGGINQGLGGLWKAADANPALSNQFALAPLHVRISAKAYAICTAVPGPWYSSALLNAGYMHPKALPWPKNPSPTWEDQFGPNGALRRTIIALVLADGITATITSEATFSKEDQHSIQHNAPNGLWPLYLPDNKDVVSNDVTFNEDDSLIIKTVTQSETLVLLGNHVMEISQYLGHATP